MTERRRARRSAPVLRAGCLLAAVLTPLGCAGADAHRDLFVADPAAFLSDRSDPPAPGCVRVTYLGTSAYLFETADANVLVDPYVSRESVWAFVDEMEASDVDYQLIMYAGAVHAFTQTGAGNDPTRGAAYDAAADRRSWEHMRAFLAEVLH